MDALLRFTRDLAAQTPQHAIRLLDPPFCYGAWRGPRIDLDVLALKLRDALADGARGVVLSDIPDDDDSLERALRQDGVLGALAVGCGHLDLWVIDPIAAALADVCQVRRSADSSLACARIDDPMQVRSIWNVLEAADPASSEPVPSR